MIDDEGELGVGASYRLDQRDVACYEQEKEQAAALASGKKWIQGVRPQQLATTQAGRVIERFADHTAHAEHKRPCGGALDGRDGSGAGGQEW